MMKLSRYAVDPLNSSIELWQHPITQAQVRLSPALKSRLPEILQVDLSREAEGPHEVLNQLLAAELRDMGFLIPAAFADQEDLSIALHRPPVLPACGFFAQRPQSLASLQSGRKSLFLTVGSESAVDSSEPFSGLRQHTATRFGQGRILDLSQQRMLGQDLFGDLGHLCSRGLSSSQVLGKLSQLLPFIPKESIPVLLLDEAHGIVQLLREPRLWSHEPALAEAPMPTLIFDREARFGQGLDPHIERLQTVSARNLFAQLQWSKTASVADTYVGLPAFVTSQAHPGTLRDLLEQNTWITEADLAAKPEAELLRRNEGHSQHGAAKTIILVHRSLFVRSAPCILQQKLAACLRHLARRNQLQAVIYWGFEAASWPETDAEALSHSFLALASGLASAEDLKS